MVPLFADRRHDLVKLKEFGEWEPHYEKFEHICSDCLGILARKRCAICSEWFNVLEDHRDLLLKNFREHGQDASRFADKKHICQTCFEKLRFFRCGRCSRALLASENQWSDYAGNDKLLSWLCPLHSGLEDEWTFNGNVLCGDCYKVIRRNVSEIALRYKNWAGGTKGEFLPEHRVVKELGRIEENRQMQDPESVATSLKLYACQIGGNGYIRYFWERHQERHAEEYVAGYGAKGNPYYRTQYRTEVWYTGYATAVLAEPKSNVGNRQSGGEPKRGERPKSENEFARILGLKGKVTRSEISEKYRQLAKQYHPDRVADLGPELKQLAEKKMKEINQAYEFYREKYGF